MKRRKRGVGAVIGPFMSVGEATDLIGIARQNVLRAIDRGALRAGWQPGPFGPAGGRYLVPVADVMEYRKRMAARRKAGRARGTV